ncbi:MAG: CRISPR-associated protein Csx15 [Thermoflexales bacterium]
MKGRNELLARVVEVHSQIDPQQPLAPQAQAMAEAAGLTPQQWQSEAILINLPSLNYSAALLLAELHGRMGYFPPIVRLRPVKDALPPRFEVAEIINLQAARDAARQTRKRTQAPGGQT